MNDGVACGVMDNCVCITGVAYERGSVDISPCGGYSPRCVSYVRRSSYDAGANKSRVTGVQRIMRLGRCT